MATPRLYNDKTKLQEIVDYLNEQEGTVSRIEICEKFDIKNNALNDRVKLELIKLSGDIGIIDKIRSGGYAGGAARKNSMYKTGKNLVIAKWQLDELNIPDGQRFSFGYDKKKGVITLTPTENEYV